MSKLDTVGCYGNCIRVANGYFDMVKLDPAEIDLETIARGIAKEFRFRHAVRNCTVAEHVVHCTMIYLVDCASRNVGYDPNEAKAILLHDGAEGIMKDLAKPIKNLLPDYQVLDNSVQMAVYERFGVVMDERIEGLIKKLDYISYKAEKKFLWPEDTEQWEGLEDVPYCKLYFYDTDMEFYRLQAAKLDGIESGQFARVLRSICEHRMDAPRLMFLGMARFLGIAGLEDNGEGEMYDPHLAIATGIAKRVAEYALTGEYYKLDQPLG